MMRRRGMGVIGTAVVVGGAAHMGAKSAQQSQAAAAPPPEPAAPAAPAEADYVAEIEQLNQLKAQGILTDEEFEAKKKQILGI